MPSHEGKRPRLRAAAIGALMRNATLEDAAQECGVSSSTLVRWMRDPEFMGELYSTQAAAIDGMTRRLVTMAPDVVEALEAGLGDGNKIEVRLRAVDIFLARLLQLRQMVDFEQRLQELERRTAPQNTNL